MMFGCRLVAGSRTSRPPTRHAARARPASASPCRTARTAPWHARAELRYRGAVPLTDEQAWTLTSAGLVALADGVLKGGEAGRILALVTEKLAPEDQDVWIDRLSDRA